MKKSEARQGQRVKVTSMVDTYATITEVIKASAIVRHEHGAEVRMALKGLELVAQPEWRCPTCSCDTTHYRRDMEGDMAIECTACGLLVKAEWLWAEQNREEPKLGDISEKAWHAAAREMACAGEAMLDERPGFSFGEFAGESDCEIVERVTGLCFHELTNEQQEELLDIFLKGDADQLLPMNPGGSDDMINLVQHPRRRSPITKAALELGNLVTLYMELRLEGADHDRMSVMADRRSKDTARTRAARNESKGCSRYMDGCAFGFFKSRQHVEGLMEQLGLDDAFQLIINEKR